MLLYAQIHGSVYRRYCTDNRLQVHWLSHKGLSQGHGNDAEEMAGIEKKLERQHRMLRERTGLPDAFVLFSLRFFTLGLTHAVWVRLTAIRTVNRTRIAVCLQRPLISALH